ncbi:MAG: 3-phosphoshikimate 1-carboxyvinyltransferase [Defluviitaleaceae bacterium]|nr:3-phosphoshikimate 1-carboxyvinyltransferase [Defluviitaleaceae bacterium]
MIKKILPAKKISGSIKVPGDKSISHRAIMLCSLADGISKITGIQTGEDCLSTVNIMRALGIRIDLIDDEAEIHGKGLHGLKEPAEALNAKNSGTAMRLLSGILAWQPFNSIIIGDDSLSKRPMSRIIRPLSLMGADIQGVWNYPPLKITGRYLSGIEYEMPIESAQVKSAILLSGLGATGKTVIYEPIKTRAHTEIMLKQLGADISINGNTIILNSCDRLTPAAIKIPGDFSSAAFFIVAALITPNSQITIKNVGISKERIGLLDVLKDMGAKIKITQTQNTEGEPTADIEVCSSRLTAVEIDKNVVSRMIDEIPIFTVAAAVANGTSIVKDAEELKVKESNRIRSMTEGLSKIGADIKETKDGFIISGKELKGGNINSNGDHRVAMSLAIAGLASKEGVAIENYECTNISYPSFFEDLKKSIND